MLICNLEGSTQRRVHRGVYAVGHTRLTQRARWMAATLAYGATAVLSHRSAAGLWSLRPVTSGAIDVTVPVPFQGRPGFQVHRAVLPADESRLTTGSRSPSSPRTILDLAAVAPKLHVERALHEAEVRRLHDTLSLPDLLERYPRSRGARTVKAILAELNAGVGVTRSELEERFLAFVDEYGLPRPELNVPIRLRNRWIEADCVWRDRRVIVELDGRAAHDTARAYERDRVRDRQLSALGWHPIRVTWQQLHTERADLAADLRTLLA